MIAWRRFLRVLRGSRPKLEAIIAERDERIRDLLVKLSKWRMRVVIKDRRIAELEKKLDAMDRRKD